MNEYLKPLPNPLNWESSRPFWEAAKRHELVVPHCRGCDRLFFYPREACPQCLSFDIDWRRVSGNGRLYSFTVIHRPANQAFQSEAPYVYALINLDEGPRLVSNLVGCLLADAVADMPVTAVFEDVTPDWTLVKFRPLERFLVRQSPSILDP